MVQKLPMKMLGYNSTLEYRPELTPDSEADPSAGIYEVFPGISGEGEKV